MSQDKTLKEGPLDFLRGAGAEVGKKVSNSAPVRAGREIYQAGQAASQAGDRRSELHKITAQLANVLAFMEKIRPLIQQAQVQQSGLALQPKGQQTQQPVQQANPRVRAGTPVQASAAQTPGAMRVKHNGPQMQFNSFMQALHGDDATLTEGLGDFLKGAGGEIRQKVGDKINQYGAGAARAMSTFSDIYQSGMKAHGAAKSAKQAEEQKALAIKYDDAKNQASTLLKQMLKAAAPFGDSAGTELMNAARKSGGNMAKKIEHLIQQHGPTYGVKL